jgi:hypothetical protein
MARVDLWRAHDPTSGHVNRAFILGCGRSGTTILGQVLEHHPGITYFYEPKGQWAMVEPNTDIMGRYFPWRSASLLGDGDVNVAVRTRFRKLFPADTPLALDKSPDGVFRFEFLSALDPEAKFIHIVRDGVDVAESISERSKEVHPLVGRHYNNGWWGIDDAKWSFLRKVAVDRGYLVQESANADSYVTKGLCEWLLGLHEIRLHRLALGDRLLEIKYNELVGDARSTLERVAAFLQLEPDEAWLAQATAKIRPQARRTSSLVVTSAELQSELARGRADYGFSG